MIAGHYELSRWQGEREVGRPAQPPYQHRHKLTLRRMACCTAYICVTYAHLGASSSESLSKLQPLPQPLALSASLLLLLPATGPSSGALSSTLSATSVGDCRIPISPLLTLGSRAASAGVVCLGTVVIAAAAAAASTGNGEGDRWDSRVVDASWRST